MLDRYIVGSVERVSPEAPVPVVRVLEERFAVGGAANVAANVTALGSTCRLVGHVGMDPEGDVLLAALEAAGVARDGVVRDGARPTTVKTRVLAKHQQIVRFDRETEVDLEKEIAEKAADKIRELTAYCDVVVVQDYNKGVLGPAVIATTLGAVRDRGVPCVVDPKRRNFFSYPGVTVLKPNARELSDALGEIIHVEDPDWMESIRARLGCQHLLVTLGDRGMALQTASREHLRLPTLAQAVYDVSGAGDTVSAVAAVALGAGASVVEAAALANHAAAVEVTKAGVQTVSSSEIEAHVRAHPEW